jgi:predicted amidohydrolase YtcJ
MKASSLFGSSLLLSSLMLVGCGQEQAPTSQTQAIQADSIYLNAKVYTVDKQQPWAEAFAVKGGKFLDVGKQADIKQLQGDNTQVIDLQGQLVLPGLIDDHIHPDMAVETHFAVAINPEGTTFEEFQQLIKDYAAANPDEEWIFGGNLDYLMDNNEPIAIWGVPSNKAILDELIPDRPAYFWDVGGHAGLVNSKALELLGITKDTPDPVGGEYIRDENGELTGVLRETGAHVVWEEYLKTRPSVEEIAHQRIKPVLGYLNSLGFTSITDIWAREWFLQSYKRLNEDNALTMRMAVYVTDPADWVSPWMKELAMKPINDPASYSSGNVDVLGVKFVLDGAAAGQTAAMVDPYEGSDDYRGPWRNDPVEFAEKLLAYDKKGLTVRAHGAGDAAIRVTLDAIERARKENNSTLRHGVAHTAILNPADIQRFKELNVTAESSPVFWYYQPAVEVIRNDIGPRLNWLFPLRDIVDSEANYSFGSDWQVSAPHPFHAMETLITRRAPGVTEGPALNTAQSINLEEALYGYTMGGAYSRYKENELGSITTGKLADFIVVDQDIFNVPVHTIHKTQVLRTVMGGNEVFNMDRIDEVTQFGR